MKEPYERTSPLKFIYQARHRVQWCISSVAEIVCCLVQAKADHARDSDQLRIAKTQLHIINPGKLKPQMFRSEYEKIHKENASLKTAAAGSKEVQISERT